MEQPRARSSFVQWSHVRTCRVTRLFGRRSDLLPINTASSQSPGGETLAFSGGDLVVRAPSEHRPSNACSLRRGGDRRDVVGAPPAQALCPAALGIATLRS